MIKEAEDGCPQFDTTYIVGRAEFTQAMEINKALREWWEKQTVVFGERKYSEGALWDTKPIPRYVLNARLCGIRPIKKESAEDILREIVSRYHNSSSEIHSLILRAKTFLENK